MISTEQQVADYLLQIKAIKLQPATPFTWASGWLSPIYCDNRKTLSYPQVRTYIRNAFTHRVRELYPEAEVIAGVATGAIAQGALVAEQMDLPFVYIRSGTKDHGLGNRIEGALEPGQKVVVIEDLISTGGSSLRAVDALRKADCQVLGMLAIFTYGFPQAEENFTKADCRINTLSDYSTLLSRALETGYIQEEDTETLMEWRKNPSEWGKQ